jgi:polyisoprenoid-binding protein YceI
MQMKKMIILLFAISTSAVLFAQNSPSRYLLSASENELVWSASYVVMGGHEGTLRFISGYLDDSTPTLTGEFVFDMSSIENTDIKPSEDGDGLEEHLRAEDFFDTAKFPKGFFTILKTESTSVIQRFTVTGFLTLKGIANEITFPAMIIKEKETMKVKAEITINRTKWGINFHSKSVFADLKDGVISDDVSIKLDLVLRKESAQPR